MPLAGSNGQLDQGGDSQLDILADVSLESFNANPSSIGPFGASVLSWRVTGPSGFHVELNGQIVTKSGEQVVQPASTTTYRLTAKAGQFSKALGTCRVAVDIFACQLNSLLNPRHTIQAPLSVGIANSGDLYFRDSPPLPEVTFSPGRIRVQLHLGKHLKHFDVDVDIDASFGLTVRDGTLEATNEQISVDVSLPWWVELLRPFAEAFTLTIIGSGGAETDPHEAVHNAIQGVVEFLDVTNQSPGLRKRSVRVDNGNNGNGIIEITECPDVLLRQFAAISQAKAPSVLE